LGTAFLETNPFFDVIIWILTLLFILYSVFINKKSMYHIDNIKTNYRLIKAWLIVVGFPIFLWLLYGWDSLFLTKYFAYKPFIQKVTVIKANCIPPLDGKFKKYPEFSIKVKDENILNLYGEPKPNFFELDFPYQICLDNADAVKIDGHNIALYGRSWFLGKFYDKYELIPDEINKDNLILKENFTEERKTETNKDQIGKYNKFKNSNFFEISLFISFNSIFLLCFVFGPMSNKYVYTPLLNRYKFLKINESEYDFTVLTPNSKFSLLFLLQTPHWKTTIAIGSYLLFKLNFFYKQIKKSINIDYDASMASKSEKYVAIAFNIVFLIFSLSIIISGIPFLYFRYFN
jgi:hypothetical protein